ncbi:DUF58 domain-containing protein [Oscillatoria salina]|uniref:DUF58 domain-containing protein n=1 Tax=Oscillatoria salina TaxID=331517 RepID=UPI0013B5B3C9|nr:DUF58 domain-containing protein [Oscillatoria salina]MBZ8180179.1 DUF58 domain-containing protein [Oscillatoria salina IIICB1]NET88584.1 DUF58 domain-containing protein [Kamptonema sp. SIO1D9]
MIPASRFYLLLLLGIPVAAILAIIFNVAIALLTILVCDLFLLVVAFWDGWRVKKHKIEIKRQPFGRLSIGRDNPVVLSIVSRDRPARILIRDYYPVQFSVSQSTLTATLPANTTQELTYTIHPDLRGEFDWGDIQVRQRGKLGLAWHDWQVTAKEKVAVYPDLIGLRSLSIRLALENTGTMRQARRLGQGTEFTELREYGIGDDTRLIDWKATARRSRPLVRVLEPEKEQTLLILLDRGRLMTARVEGLKRFDWGLNATLSLALAGLSRGDRVGVGVFDRHVTTWIPPERGQHQLSQLIDYLTPIQPVLLEPDYFGAVTRLVTQQTRRALVVLITDIIDVTASTELLSALMRLTPRYLPFCVTLRDPLVDKIAHNPKTTTKTEAEENLTSAKPANSGESITAYRRAIALDLLAQRQVAFAKLKQKGVLVLDAPASQISEQLVDRYLQLKARNLL